jgi:hypothetical protein
MGDLKQLGNTEWNDTEIFCQDCRFLIYEERAASY